MQALMLDTKNEHAMKYLDAVRFASATKNYTVLKPMILSLLNQGAFNEVASLDTRKVETAYYLTQNIESNWGLSENPLIHVYKKGKVRSTGIGDLFINYEDDGSQTLYVCMPAGFYVP